MLGSKECVGGLERRESLCHDHIVYTMYCAISAAFQCVLAAVEGRRSQN